jgi:hypothetical protein
MQSPYYEWSQKIKKYEVRVTSNDSFRERERECVCVCVCAKEGNWFNMHKSLNASILVPLRHLEGLQFQ